MDKKTLAKLAVTGLFVGLTSAQVVQAEESQHNYTVIAGCGGGGGNGGNYNYSRQGHCGSRSGPDYRTADNYRDAPSEAKDAFRDSLKTEEARRMYEQFTDEEKRAAIQAINRDGTKKSDEVVKEIFNSKRGQMKY